MGRLPLRYRLRLIEEESMSQIRTDLERGITILSQKEIAYSRWWRYYDGIPPLVYSTEKLREIFDSIDVRFSENWASVIVDAALDRLSMNKPRILNDDALSSRLSELWESSGAWLDEMAVYEDVLITGEGFLCVWPEEDDFGRESPKAYHNDSRRVHIHYDPDFPRRKKWAVKWWKSDDDRVRLNIYYPDRIEFYEALKEKPTSVSSYSLIGVEENPYGEIPIFHFRASPREPRSQLVPVVEILDLVNKLLNDLSITAEFMSAPQRYIITHADLSELRNSPSEIWRIPPAAPGDQPTAVGQFSSADLMNYLAVISHLSGDIASISRTPRHYFFSGEAPSGEALRILEAPLVSKLIRITDFGLIPAWKEVVRFLLKLDGTEVPLSDIDVTFQPFESSQTSLTSTVRLQSVQAGIPLPIVLRREGWTEEEIQQMREVERETKLENVEFAQIAFRAQKALEENEQETEPIPAERWFNAGRGV